MADVVRTLVAPLPDDTPYAVLRHALSRVGTGFRSAVDRYDGVKPLGDTCAFGGAHASHLVSVVAGRGASGRFAVSVRVTPRRGAVHAVIAFPIVVLAALVAAWTLAPTPLGMAAGLGVGVALGGLFSYGAFRSAMRSGGTEGRAVVIAAKLARTFDEALTPLGLDVSPATSAEFPPSRLAEAEASPDPQWREVVSEAVGALVA